MLITIFNAITILDVLGYIGDIACVIGGILAARKVDLCPFMQLLSGMSTAFFGSIFLRDVGLLRTMPSIFSSPLEIVTAVAVGIIAVAILNRCGKGKHVKALNVVLHMADSLGAAGAVAFGYGRGITMGVPWWTALACAFVTACGGGIIAAGIRSVGTRDWRHFSKTLARDFPNYILCALASAVYGFWYSLFGYSDAILIALTILAVRGGFIAKMIKMARG